MTRSGRHADLQAWFAARGDAQLQDLVDAAPVVGRGIGGVHRIVEVLDGPVFVKQVPLTDLELSHPRSTANLFELPPELHWGVNSVGLGAWRELAANLAATALFADARCLAVPLLHDWRILGPPPGEPVTELDEFGVDEVVAHWHDEESVRRRVEALATAPASLTMFLEYVPETVATWLRARCAEGDEAFREAVLFLRAELTRGIGELLINGIRHHDPHLANALTDGRSVLFADLGLAVSMAFDLDDAERAFLEETELHDLAYVLTKLMNAIINERMDLPDVAARYAVVRDLAAGGAVPEALAPVADVVVGLAPGAAVFNAWFWDLYGGSRPPYPGEAIRAAFDQGGFG